MTDLQQNESLDLEAMKQYEAEENREISQGYNVVCKHASGGCSVIYDAWRLSDGTNVAIKVLALPPGLDENEAVLSKYRFFREARILMALKNEHSVKCYEYGLFNGAPCVVLEFVQGQQLDEYLREYGALPFEYGIDIVCQVLEALGEAHSCGVIHRDIKPANVMIVQDSVPPVARLLDFGIATLAEGALGELMKTKLGAVRGTPSYMAPELFTGNVAASPESDIFAIGLVLLEILTGCVAVSGASLVQIAFKQAHEEICIPMNVPECLACIIRKCCTKNPENRYHSCDVLIRDLQAAKPKAIEQRASCEAAYLQSIKEGNKTEQSPSNANNGSFKKVVIALIAVIILLVGIGSVAFFSMSSDHADKEAQLKAQTEEAEAMKAKQLEAERQAAREKAEKEAQLKEAEEKAKAAEEARLKAEAEAKAALEAKAEMEAKAAEEAVAAEETKPEEVKPAVAKTTQQKKTQSKPSTRPAQPDPAVKPAPAKTSSRKGSGPKKDQSAIPLSIL